MQEGVFWDVAYPLAGSAQARRLRPFKDQKIAAFASAYKKTSPKRGFLEA